MRISKLVLDLILRKIVVTPKTVSEILGISIKQAQNALQYLLRTGRVKKICWGLYTAYMDPKVIGCHIAPSYISFISALSLHGITTQIVNTYDLATIHRVTISEKCLSKLNIRYIKIPRRAFLGYAWRISSMDNGKYFIAEPEKAIVDTIYIGQNPIRMAIDWSRIDAKKLIKYSKYYPRKVQKKVLEVLSFVRRYIL